MKNIIFEAIIIISVGLTIFAIGILLGERHRENILMKDGCYCFTHDGKNNCVTIK